MVCGWNIYGCQTATKAKPTLSVDVTLGAEKYSLLLKAIRSVDLSTLSSTKSGENILPLNFLNNLIKNFFASMKFVTIGRSGKYFNPKSKKLLSSAGIVLFNGF